MKKIDTRAPENLKVELFREELIDDITVLVVKAEGVIRKGSKGSQEAIYLKSQTAQGAVLTLPDAVVLDFSDLDYSWGNGIEYPVEIARIVSQDDKIPIALVVGTKSETGVRSYFGDRYKIFHKLDEGIQAAEKDARECIRSLLRT